MSAHETTTPASAATTPATTGASDGRRRRGWAGVVAVAVGSFGTVLSEFLPIGLLPSIAADLHVQTATAGLMVVVTGLAAAVAAPVVTVATSRADRRLVLIGLSAVLVLSDVLAATAWAFPVLLGARVLLGVALGGFWAIGAGIAGRLVAETDTIRATSLITAGISIATVVSLPLGALVAATSTWRLAFVIGAAVGVLALVLQSVTLPSVPSQRRVRPVELVALFRIPRARIGLLVAALFFGAQFAAYTYVSPFLQDLARVSPEVVSVALLVFGVAGIVGNFVAGVTLGRSVLGTLTVAGTALAASVVLLPLVAHDTAWVVVLIVVWGAVWGALPLGLQTWMATATPTGAETGLAMFVTTIQVALALGSTVGGVAVAAAGIAVDFDLAAGIAVVGTVALVGLVGRSTRASRVAGATRAAPPVAADD